MDLHAYKQLTASERKKLDAVSRTEEEQKDFDTLKELFKKEIENEVQNFENADKKIDLIISEANLDNREDVESVETELNIKENLDKLNQGAEETGTEAKKATEEKIPQTLKAFIETYGPGKLTTPLSEQLEDAKNKIKKFEDVFQFVYNKENYKEIPLGIEENPEIKKILQDLLIRTLSEKADGRDQKLESFCREYIEPDFFETDEYKKAQARFALKRIEIGDYKTDNEVIVKQGIDEFDAFERYGAHNKSAETTFERSLLKIDPKYIPEQVLKETACAGLVARFKSKAAYSDRKDHILEYKNAFSLSEEEMQSALKAAILQSFKKGEFALVQNVDADFPELAAYISTPEVKSAAREGIIEIFRSGKINSSTAWVGRYASTLNELEKPDMQEALKDGILNVNSYFFGFDSIKEHLALCTEETRQAVFNDPKIVEDVTIKFGDYIASHQFEFKKLLEMGEKNIVPPEIISRVKKYAIAKNAEHFTGHEQQSSSSKKIKDLLDKLQASPEETEAGLSLAYLKSLTPMYYRTSGQKENNDDLKTTYLPNGLSTDEFVVETFQKNYLKMLAEGKVEYIEKDSIPSEFLAVPKGELKQIVETAILSALKEGNGKIADILNEKFYPETHNFFEVSEEVLQTAKSGYKAKMAHLADGLEVTNEIQPIGHLERKFLWADPEFAGIKEQSEITLLEANISSFGVYANNSENPNSKTKNKERNLPIIDHHEVSKKYFAQNSDTFSRKQFETGNSKNIGIAVSRYPDFYQEGYNRFIEKAGNVVVDEECPPEIRKKCAEALHSIEIAGNRHEPFKHLSKFLIQELGKGGGSVSMDMLYSVATRFSEEASKFDETAHRALTGKNNFRLNIKNFYGMEEEEYVDRVKEMQKTLLDSSDPGMRFIGLRSFCMDEKFTLKHAWEANELHFSFDERQQKALGGGSFIKESILRELTDLAQKTPESLDKNNWSEYLYGYVAASENRTIHNEKDRKKLLEVFESESKRKDECLQLMQADWKEYLKTGEMSLDLRSVSAMIAAEQSAGNMKMIESLGLFSWSAYSVLKNTDTAESTKKALTSFLDSTEDRFTKEKWTEMAKTSFYDISKEMMNASPSLFVEFAPLINELNPAEFKTFFAEIYPLYHAKLLIAQKETRRNTFANDPRELVKIRNEIRSITESLIGSGTDRSVTFMGVKSKLNASFSQSLSTRFGLVAEQKEMNETKVKTLQNAIRYIGTVADRTTEKETIISSFMALHMEGAWEKFRAGSKDIDLQKYFDEPRGKIIKKILEDRPAVFEKIRETVGIAAQDEEAFNLRLQAPTTNTMTGNITTIDEKVGIVKRNIDELSDPDLYQSEEEQNIVALLRKEGKNVQATMAKIFAISSGKGGELTSEESAIEKQLQSTYKISKWDKDTIRAVQDKIKPYSLISDVVTKVNEQNVEGKIDGLRKSLIPNEEIMRLFNKVGEDFKQESGAIALSQDLAYLENIIVKNEAKFSEDEKKLTKEYLEGIRQKMQILEKTFIEMKEYVSKVKKSSHSTGNPQLKEKLKELEDLINAENSTTALITEMSSDMNFFIENIRACLSCKERGANNDTNLSFGEPTKFFVGSKSENNAQTVADQLVYFYPKTEPDGKTTMSFVLDQIYGNKSSDMLIAHTMTVVKKYKQLKVANPEAKMDILVTKEAMASCGLNEEIFKNKINQLYPDLGMTISDMDSCTVNVLPSSFSDPYIEFGVGFARGTGEREAGGVVLS